MDIRFCDLCNESVPEADLAKGRAFLRKGRVICASCEQAMGGMDEPDPPPARRRGGPTAQEVAASLRPALSAEDLALAGAEAPGRRGGGTAAFALALGVGAVAAVGFGGTILLDRIDALEGELVETRLGLAAAMAETRAERQATVEPILRQIGDVEVASRTATAAAQAAAEVRVAQLEKSINEAAGREAQLRASLDESRVQVAQVRTEAAEAREQTAEFATRLERVIEFHGDQLIELQERIREAGALAASGGAPAGAPIAGAAAQAPSWDRHLADLKSPDEGIRLDAVFALGDTGDTAVVPHVIPMLKDEDIFVRMVAAQALDDLRAKTAVPALIDTLDDERSPVREAAVIALRNITGQNFGFDPAARDADRKKRVDQWRAWWRRSGDDFLTS